MKRVLLSLLLLSNTFNSILFSQENNNATWNISPYAGLAINNLSFNIAGNELGTNPNILSELKWNKTLSVDFGVRLDYTIKNFQVNGDFTFSQNLSGNVSDIDYNRDNRQGAYSELYLSNHKGNGFSFRLEPGFQIIKTNSSTFGPFISFQYAKNRNYLLNQKQWTNRDMDYINGLNSYYEYKFPEYGLGLFYNQKLTDKLNVDFKISGSYSQYYAYGNWNLRSEFLQPVSYEHKGQGYSIRPDLKFTHQLSRSTALNLGYRMHYYYMSDGKDYLYTHADGLTKSKLNEVEMMNHQILVGIKYNIK